MTTAGDGRRPGCGRRALGRVGGHEQQPDAALRRCRELLRLEVLAVNVSCGLDRRPGGEVPNCARPCRRS